MSHVLVDTLSRGEIDFALAYDVPNLPHLRRTELLREDLVLVALPQARNGEPVAFAEVMEESLIMPESGDRVRDLVVRTARELGLEPKIAFEVRSVPAIKNLIFRGVGVGILPYGSVLEELRGGKLDARQIISPALRRTLYLASSNKRSHFKNEIALTGVIRSSLRCLTDVVGPLAHPVPPLEPEAPSTP
jgi:LysR family nitrogen assimilation transcriptional regulator